MPGGDTWTSAGTEDKQEGLQGPADTGSDFHIPGGGAWVSAGDNDKAEGSLHGEVDDESEVIHRTAARLKPFFSFTVNPKYMPSTPLWSSPPNPRPNPTLGPVVKRAHPAEENKAPRQEQHLVECRHMLSRPGHRPV